MAYSTPVLVRLILTSVDSEQGGTAADLSDAQIQHEIDGAEADIDSKLRARYVTPFDADPEVPVPFIIQQIATDIAAYKSDLNYRKSREYDNALMPIMLRFKDAEELLCSLRKGGRTLDWPRSSIGALVVSPGDGPFITVDNVFERYPRW